MKCPFCKLAKVSKWYLETPEYFIIDCITCHSPMIIAREHGKLSEQKLNRLLSRFKIWCAVNISYSWYIDQQHKTVLDHWYAHVRRDCETM